MLPVCPDWPHPHTISHCPLCHPTTWRGGERVKCVGRHLNQYLQLPSTPTPQRLIRPIQRGLDNSWYRIPQYGIFVATSQITRMMYLLSGLMWNEYQGMLLSGKEKGLRVGCIVWSHLCAKQKCRRLCFHHQAEHSQKDRQDTGHRFLPGSRCRQYRKLEALLIFLI